jgi:hypothetical protein
MGIIIFFLVYFNSCLHELQKLNCYNHVFLIYFQLLELDLKFVEISGKKLKYLKVGVIFLQMYIYIFFKHFNIDVVNILILFFWLVDIFFITKIIPNHWKNDLIVGVFSQIQMIWHKLLWEAKGRLGMPMKKNPIFNFFEMLEEG